MGTTRRLSRKCEGRAGRAAALLVAALGVGAAVPAPASQLLAPSVGVPDGALMGATVARPLTPTAAAFSNPAGLMALEAGSVSAAFALPVGHTRLHATAPAGYDTTSDFVATAPEGGSVFDLDTGTRLGFAIYGSQGSQFHSDADAAAGVPFDFYSSGAVTNVALMAAHRVTDRLSLGVGASLVYGENRLRYTQGIPFAYTVRGPGVQANVGLTYHATDRVDLGLSVRTPGMVWSNGDTRLPSGDEQDVELRMNLPTQVFLGANVDVTDRLHVGVVGRWTDASTFSGSWFRFEQTPAANVPFIGEASDEWRIAAGASWQWTESISLAASFGYADAIVPDTFVSPLIMDSNEWKIGGGVSWDMPGFLEGWTLDATIGGSPTGARNVQAGEAVIFPGRYTIGGEIYMIGVRTTR